MAFPATQAQFEARFARDFIYGTGLDTVTPNDITNAMNDALTNFNVALFGAVDVVFAFCYATAHFLVLNVRAAGGLSRFPGKGFDSYGEGLIQGTGVGGVNVSYQLPQRFINDPYLYQFMQTGYGQRYLSMLVPRLYGPVAIAAGYNSNFPFSDGT